MKQTKLSNTLLVLVLSACGKNIKSKVSSSLSNNVAPNQAPSVFAGNNNSLTLPSTLNLSGSASDDGENSPNSILLVQWSKISGPGTVLFSDPFSLNTVASFSAAGTYTLRLKASDGELDSSDDIIVSVSQAPNQTPIINAGSDKNITLPASVSLTASATDDGPLSSLSFVWSKVSGPGTISFSSPVASSTSATFSTAGTYVVRASVSDGSASASDDVTITVNPAVIVNNITKLSLTGPTSVIAGNCSSQFQVIAQDSNNLERSATQNISISINGLGTAQLFSNSTCTTSLSTPLITSGSSRLSFYIKDSSYNKDNVPFNLSLNAQANGLSSSNTLSLSQNAGVATRLIFATQPSPTGTAEALLQTQPILKIVDANSNKVASFSENVTLSATRDPSCTQSTSGILFGNETSANSGVASFNLIKYSDPETIYLKATASGLSAACSNAIVLNPKPIETHTLRISLIGTGGGEVLSSRSNSGQNISCNLSNTPATGICEVEAPAGTVFKLMPLKDSSSFIAGFSGTNCSYDPAISNDNNNCTLTLNQDLDIDVVFQSNEFPMGSQGLPLFSNIVISNVGRNSATISWDTSKAADSRIRYGTTTTFNTHSSLEPELKTSHLVTMTELQPNTTYYFRALSRDITGLMNSSNVFSFTTAP